MNDEIIFNRITDWLNSQGYPLEMDVSEVLHKLNFHVLQSEYYIDDETSNHREIDIVADVHKEISDVFLRLSLIVECKVSKDKPWIIFTSRNSRLASPARVAQRAGSRIGNSILKNLAHKKEIQDLPLFQLPERPGYGLTQAFTSGNDVAYNSCISVSKATRAISKSFDEIKGSKYANICFPVIVIDGRLFESFLDENNEMKVSEINEGTLLWRNPIIGMPHTVIKVITKSNAEDYFTNIKTDFIQLFDFINSNPSVVTNEIQLSLRSR